MPAILATGLRKYLVLQTLDYEPAKIEEQVVKSMDDYSVHIVAALERHLPILATISSAAPMLGFLGTVQGMIVAFDDIVAKMGETNIVSAAAEGIKVSLMTTCFGLIVGIPAFVAFNYFTGIINRFVLDVEESATEMIEAVTLQTAIGAVEEEVKAEDEVKRHQHSESQKNMQTAGGTPSRTGDIVQSDRVLSGECINPARQWCPQEIPRSEENQEQKEEVENIENA